MKNNKSGLLGLMTFLLLTPLSHAQIPPTLGWYQIPNTKIRPLCPPYPEIQSIEGCTAVMADWSGGLFDTKRNRFIIHGGGHNGYYGNEIYAIDLNANPIVPLLVKDASHGTAISNVSSCPEAFSDGTPNARHTYNGQLYLPNQDAYFLYGAGLSPCGNFSDGQWQFNPNTLTWSQQTPSLHPSSAQNGSVPQFAYDPITAKIYEVEANTGIFWSYDPAANVWTNLANVTACFGTNSTTIIDPVRRLYFCIGSGQFNSISLNSPYTVKQLSGSGCSALIVSDSLGFAYDPVQKLEVGWVGGNTVYTYNPDTDSCSTITGYTGGPTTIQANGTFGRFQYSPASGVFVVVNDIDSNVYSLRLTNGAADTTPPTVAITVPANGATVSGTINVAGTAADNVAVSNVQVSIDGGAYSAASGTTNWTFSLNTTTLSNASHTISAKATDTSGNVSVVASITVTVNNSTGGTITPEQDFANRCKAPGVIACEGFDDPAEFVPGTSPNTGLYSNSGNIVIVQDTVTKSSGFGSLHFPIKANAGTDPTVLDNNWLQTFCGAHPPAACTPTVFQENSDFYVQFRYRVDSNYVNTNWELTQNGGSSPKIADIAHHTSSCGQTELTLNNRGGTAMPMMYGACGGYGMYVQTGTTLENQNTPYNFQSDYYNCEYPQTPHGPGGCFTMPANTWMTFYEHVHIGNYNQSNSVMETWVSTAVTDSLKYLIHITNFTMPPPDGGEITGYDAIWFNVYMTNFNPAATNPAANVWLDEVIVSTQPIAAPGGSAPPPDTIPPTVPTNLAAAVVSSSQINLSWTASTDNVGVTGYKVFRCQGSGCTPSVQIATPTSNSFQNTGLSASTTFVYTVSAFDAAGNNSAQSGAVSAVTLPAPPPDTTPPTVAITSPANNATVSGVITVAGTAADNVGVTSVALSIDNGAFNAANGTNNWTFSLNTFNLTQGAHTLKAQAKDAAGNVGSSAVITINVPVQAPPAITFVQGAASIPAGAGNISLAFPANVKPGDALIVAGTWGSASGNLTCTDNQGDVFAVSAQAVVYDAGNTQALGLCYALNAKGGATTVTINFPSTGFTGASIQEYSGVAATGALDAAVASMGAGSTAANAVTSGNATTLTAGDLIFGAAIDDSGAMAAFTAGTGYTLREQPTPANSNSMATEDMVQSAAGSVAATFTENLADHYLALLAAFKAATSTGTPPSDTIPPTAAITSPANGATVSGTITVSGTAADNVAVANVQVSIDGGAYSAASGTTSWTFSLNTTTLSNASHTISAKATDTSGNVSTVASITVTVNNTAPPPSAPVITSALAALGTAGSAFSYQITASNSPTSFNATGLPAGLTVNTGTGLISGTPNAAGTSNVTISATNAGGTGSATLALTINNPPDTVPPTVSITSPANGSILSGTVSISATASDNVGVTKVQLYLNSGLVATDTAAPYGFSWNTQQVANGGYTLTAKAYDAAGNVGTSSPISVTVQNRHSKVQLVSSPSLSFTVTSLISLQTINSNSNQANFSIEVDTAGEPSFPVAPTLQVIVSMPSGSKSVTLSQLSTGPLVYYAKLPKSTFGSQDFTRLTGTVVTITVGTMTFIADGHNDQVQPALGGTIQDPNGIAAVVVQPGQVSMETQVNIAPATPSSNLSNGLSKLNSKALGNPINIQIISSGTVTATTIVIPFDSTQISSGLTTNQVGLAYQDPVSGNWVLGNNVSLNGSAVQMMVNSGTTFVPALLMPSSIPGLKDALVFPNPAVKTDPTIRAFLGVVNSVEVTIFDTSGHVVNSGSVSGAPTGISGGQYYYDYKWTGHKASGGYAAVVHGKAADGTIVRARVRFAVVN